MSRPEESVVSGGLKHSFWFIAEKSLRLGGTFLLTMAIARSLGPEQFAILALATAISTVLGFLGSLGMESVVLRDLAQNPADTASITANYFRIRWVGALLVPALTCSYVLLAHPGDSQLLLTATILACSSLCMSWDVVDLALQARHQAMQTSAVRSAAFLIAGCVKIALVLVSGSLLWFAVAQLLEFALMASAYAAIGRRMGLLGTRARPAPSARRWLHAGRYMILSGMTVALYSKIDVLVIGSTLSRSTLGAYAIAAGLCGALNIVGMSLAQSFAPRLSQLHQADPPAYARALRHFLLLMLVVSITGAGLLSLLARPLVELLAGPQYVLAASILQVLAWSCVPVFLGVATSQIIVNEHLYGLSLLRTTAGLLFACAAIAPMAERWDAIGVAWSVVASSTLATCMLLTSSTARRQLTHLQRRCPRAQ
jgi:PST family polysaccharide transporter